MYFGWLAIGANSSAPSQALDQAGCSGAAGLVSVVEECEVTKDEAVQVCWVVDH